MNNIHTVDLDGLKVARVVAFSPELTKTNYRLVIMGESFGEEGIYYPPQEINLYGPAVEKLRELLNTLP